MPIPHHVNPDHFLNLAEAVSVSHDDVGRAWERAYAELSEKLLALDRRGTLYVVCGIQGAGKTTWIERNATSLGDNALFLDGPLPTRKHRERALGLARDAGCRAIAVWIDTPLDIAFAQNATRPGLARILEKTILRSFEQLEPPSVEEGFDEVFRIESGRPAAA